MFRTADLLVPAVLIAGSLASAADKSPTFIDKKSSGPDFQVQGEYVGKREDGSQVGVQVIALGQGKFQAVVYPGGLPGAGWNGKDKTALDGVTQEGVTTLKGENIGAEIRDGALHLTEEGKPSIKAPKVERKSPTLGTTPPKGALVLFDGTSAEAWQKGRIVEGKLLAVGTRTKQSFGDFTLHLEFRTPFMPEARGQARGNSGMYLADQYECQILDSFGLEGADNECGGIYKNAKPKINMCLPPLSWQTYDVEFQAAKFDDAGKRTAPAKTTIRHNGVVIHDDLELEATPGGGRSDEKPGPLFLQDHGNPVHFRNIWILEK